MTKGCVFIKELKGSKSPENDKRPKKGDEDFPEEKDSFHIFTNIRLKEEKCIARAINATVPAVPQWVNWSEQEIKWTRDDHPAKIDEPGRFALVVAPQVNGYKLSKTWVDGGSNINILYSETFRHMKFSES